jgi:phospholipase C
MLENRSFDHMLGLNDSKGRDARSGMPTVLDGLVGQTFANIDFDTGEIVYATGPTDYKLLAEDKDPAHEFSDVLVQLTGNRDAVYPNATTGAYPSINNGGFLSNYKDHGSAHPPKALGSYMPSQLPVLNTLAQEFAVCDRWFCSMPGPTWPNRFFAHAASSGGLDDSPSGFQSVTSTLADGYKFANGTIFDALDSHCLDWEIYEGDEFPQSFAIYGMNVNVLLGRFIAFEEFAYALQQSVYKPAYVFIEPNYGNVLPWTAGDFTCGNSQHPLDDVTRGEKLIKDVYEAIRNSPHWESSLLIITWDEHGGFYDHVSPGTTVAPGDFITDPDNDHHHFDFQQLGVRVPTVVISPWIQRNTIDHTVYDHSTIPATIEKLLGLGPLTNRDANANDLLHLVSLQSPRGDTPTTLPDPTYSGWRCDSDPPKDALTVTLAGSEPITPAIQGILHVAFLRHKAIAPVEMHPLLLADFLKIKTNAEARNYIVYVRRLVRENSKHYRRRESDLRIFESQL